MCSIFGIYSKKNEDVSEQSFSLLDSQRHRGSDGFGVQCLNPKSEKKASFLKELLPLPKSSLFLGHSLLSTTGFGLQPFSKGKVSIVHNGQIYNYKSLVDSKAKSASVPQNSKSNSLSSDSEAVALFFSKLFSKESSVKSSVKKFMNSAVGEYAIGMLKEKKLYAFRDFMGFKPIWFGENDSFLAFASDPAALVKIDIPFPQPLKPGHLLEISKNGFSVEKIFDYSDFRKLSEKKKNKFFLGKNSGKEKSFENLFSVFEEMVSFQTQGIKKAAVLFSGGIDSSVVAKAVSLKVPKTVLFVAGTKESHDILLAEKSAKLLGLPLEKIILNEQDIERLAIRSMKILSFYDEMQIGIAVPLLACAEKIKEKGFKVVFSGQGSDELFCGYSAYAKTLAKKDYSAVEDSIWFAISRMWYRNLHRDDAILASCTLELRSPLLLPPLISAAMQIPAKEKIHSIDDQIRKHPIRDLAKHYSVSNEIISMKKKAMQYGSGCQKIVSKKMNGRF